MGARSALRHNGTNVQEIKNRAILCNRHQSRTTTWIALQRATHSISIPILINFSSLSWLRCRVATAAAFGIGQWCVRLPCCEKNQPDLCRRQSLRSLIQIWLANSREKKKLLLRTSIKITKINTQSFFSYNISSLLCSLCSLEALVIGKSELLISSLDSLNCRSVASPLFCCWWFLLLQCCREIIACCYFVSGLKKFLDWAPTLRSQASAVYNILTQSF